MKRSIYIATIIYFFLPFYMKAQSCNPSIISSSTSNNYCIGSTYTLQANTVFYYHIWSVSPSGGAIIQNKFQPQSQITFTTSGTYTISLYVYCNWDGSIHGGDALVVTSDSCGVNSIQTNNNTNASLEIFPNPGHTVLNILFPLGNENSIPVLLHNSNGSIIKQFHLTSSITKIDVSDIDEGIYYLCLITPQGIVNKKIVIIR